MISELWNHLWQSTLFLGAVAVLNLMLRSNRAAVRHGLCVAASVKFLVPFALLVALGSEVRWRTAPAFTQPGTTSPTEDIGPLFSLWARGPLSSSPLRPSNGVSAVLFGLWLCGFAANSLAWWRRSRRIREVLYAGSPLPLNLAIPVMSCPARLEPCVFRIRKPVLLLPRGIADRLTPAQFQTILTHELCHVRRHDNLTAAIHMIVEALFWFHPLVWWLRARLVDERERACDEEVLRMARDPQDYAEGILNVCKFYLESPSICVAGVTGSNLKRRIETIMENRPTVRLNLARKAAMVFLAGLSAALPVVVGIINAPPIRAQSTPAATPEFEVATIKPSPPPPGDALDINLGTVRNGLVTLTNVTLNECLKFAYGIVSDAQISGPDWANSRAIRFDIVAKAPSNTDREKLLLMMQKLLSERLNLGLHHEQKDFRFLALTVGQRGTKLHEVPTGSGGNTGSRGRIVGEHMTMAGLAMLLSRFERQVIVDMTGLKGQFAVKLEWAPDSFDGAASSVGDYAGGSSLFTAVQEQLGLKLESRRGPLDVLVIDHADKVPTSN